MNPLIGAIIQARVTSSRFPRKILADLDGLPILEHVVNRVRASKLVDKIIIASPHSPECCLNEEIFIGSENDVLDRYYQAAKKYKLDVIVRITSDCPMLPPSEIDRCILRFIEGGTDYVTNISHNGRFGTPDGWDVEVFSFEALESAWTDATEKFDREHVTSYIKSDYTLNPIHLPPPKLSLDTPEDLERIRNYYELERQSYIGYGGNRFLRPQLHQAPSDDSQA